MKAASRIPVPAPLVLLLFLVGSTTLPPPAAAQPEVTLSKWKIEGTVTSGSGAGVYRRIGRHSDLGLFVRGSVSRRETDGTDDYDTSTDLNVSTGSGIDRYVAFSMSPELRHWTARTDRLNTYLGLRASANYSWYDNNAQSYRLDSSRLIYEQRRSTDLTWDVGTGLVMGAEWQVARHFGVGVKLTPVSLQYQWRRYTYDASRSEQPPDSQNDHSIDRSKEWLVRWSYVPSLVAAISF